MSINRTTVLDQGAGRAGTSGRSPWRSRAYRLLLHHEMDDYPEPAHRVGYLALAVLATIILYYTYYTQTGVTPNILRSYHMSFAFYVGVVVVSNLLGAFGSLPASKTDRLGRSNVVIYGLLVIGLLITFGVPNAGSQWSFAIVISAVGLAEGAILVATPALVRDFSPQVGRASAMGFWTIGPIAGSLVTSIVANQTLNHFVDWQSQFYVSGIAALVTFAICLIALRDLSPRLRDQLIVSAHDRALVEARARGFTDAEVQAALQHPWRQILRRDLIGSSAGIAIFLLVYYCAAGFFTIYFSTVFLNPNGTNLTTSQVNGINSWFYGADIVTLIIVGLLSDRLLVRKPFMVVGSAGSIATLIAFLGLAAHPHTSHTMLCLMVVLLAFFTSLVFGPWIASYTETIEAANPALVGTGLALWGWILRLVVAVSFIFLPMVVTGVDPLVDNQPLATHVIKSQTMQNFVVEHRSSVQFAQAHAALLRRIEPYGADLAAASKGSLAAIARLERALGPATFDEVVKYRTELATLVEPYRAQLAYLAAHQAAFEALAKAAGEAPQQWQRWFWIDLAGMVLFLPTIWLLRGRWSSRAAREDERIHERTVAEELNRLSLAGVD